MLKKVRVITVYEKVRVMKQPPLLLTFMESPYSGKSQFRHAVMEWFEEKDGAVKIQAWIFQDLRKIHLLICSNESLKSHKYPVEGHFIDLLSVLFCKCTLTMQNYIVANWMWSSCNVKRHTLKKRSTSNWAGNVSRLSMRCNDGNNGNGPPKGEN